MESLIKQAAEDARAKSALMSRGAGNGFGQAAGNPLGLGAGSSNFGIGNKRTDLTQHLEQYRHNTGWVAASIAPIAKRIARQPIFLAKVEKAMPQKAGGPRVTKSGKTVSKPWEVVATPIKSAQALWFKNSLPGMFKAVAPHADLVESHPILDALEDPNPIMVRWSLMFVTVASLMLTGKAYWWIKARERDTGDDKEKAEPRIEIWPLPSHWVNPVHTKDRLNDHWEVKPEGQIESTPVPAEQIVYFYLPDPSTLLGAQSPLQNQARAVVSDEAIAEAQRRGFANGVFPGMAIIVGRQPGVGGEPGERPALTREQRAQITTAIKQAYRGVYNADEPIILDKIIEDVKRVTNTNREMDFRESGEYTKERITQGFGVNPIVMGQVQDANRASSATADDHLCQSTVNPIIEMISQTLTAWFNPLMAEKGAKYYLYVEEAKAVDPDSDREDWKALWAAGACSKDELRAGLRSLPPMVDGNTALVAGNLVKIDARLASEAGDGGKPPEPLAQGQQDKPDNTNPNKPQLLAPAKPEGGDDGKPPANGDGSGAPAAPAQNSESSYTGVKLVEVVETLAAMARRGFTVEQAQSVLWAHLFNLSNLTIRKILDAVAVGGKVAEPTAESIAVIVRAIAENDPDLPDGRTVELPATVFYQEYPYDCGGAVGYMAANAVGIQTKSYADFMAELLTKPEYGTHAEDLFNYFAKRGANPVERFGRNVGYLRNEIGKGRYCICLVQYFGDGDQSGAEGGANESGHYVLVTGYTPTTVKFICPIDGPSEQPNEKFTGNWFDRDQDGRPFVRYCLSVGQVPKPIVDPNTNTGKAKTSRPRRKRGKSGGSKVTDSSGHERDNSNGQFTGPGASGSSSGGGKPEDGSGGNSGGAAAKPSEAAGTGEKPPSGDRLQAAKPGETLHPNVQIRNVDGKDWVVKGRHGKDAQVDNESTVSAAARKAGLDVPQVHKSTMYGQTQAVVERVEGKPLVRMSEDERREALAKVPKDTIDKHGLFDYVVGSSDPNNGNYMIGKGGKHVAIDKEQSLRTGEIGDKATARTPFFLADAQPKGKSAAEYAYDSKNVKEMIKAGETIAADLEKIGRAKDAVGVRRRVEVLKGFGDAEKVTAGDIAKAGEAYDKTNPPKTTLFGRLSSLFGR